MDSLSEVWRAREKLSEQVGHDVRALIALINQRVPEVSSRIIDPGSAADHCDPAPLREPDDLNLGHSDPVQQ